MYDTCPFLKLSVEDIVSGTVLPGAVFLTFFADQIIFFSEPDIFFTLLLNVSGQTLLMPYIESFKAIFELCIIQYFLYCYMKQQTHST